MKLLLPFALAVLALFGAAPPGGDAMLAVQLHDVRALQTAQADGSGGLWFTQYPNRVGHVLPSGELHDRAIDSAERLGRILTAPGATAWVLDSGSNALLHVNDETVLARITLPRGVLPTDLSVDVRGTVWVTDRARGEVLAIARGGVRRVHLGGASARPTAIAPSARGPIVLLAGTSRIARISGRRVHFTALPPECEGPSRLAVGSDGTVWVSCLRSASLVRISTANATSTVPLNGAAPFDVFAVRPNVVAAYDPAAARLVAVRDGRPWGDVSFLRAGAPQPGDAPPAFVTVGTGGDVWTGSSRSQTISRLGLLDAVVTPLRSPSSAPSSSALKKI